MKVSIVTVVFNAVNEIEQTIRSVICQTYNDVEYIIIDGGSTDGTIEVINRFIDKIAYFVSEPDKGIYDAMNKGLRAATGDWLNFMNVGDRFADENVLKRIVLEDKYMAIYGNAYYVTKKGTYLRKGQCKEVIYRDMPNTHQTFFVKRDIALKYGFDINYKYAADYNMMYHIYSEYGTEVFNYQDLNICYYDVRDGFSMQHPNEVFGETIRIRKIGVRKCYDLLKYIIKRYLIHKK